MAASILAILVTLTGLGYALWRKYKDPAVELARLKEREKAAQEITDLKAKQLKEDYARVEKVPPTQQDVEDALNS